MSTQAMTYMTCAETAKLVRQALKAAHPGVKFSVRSRTYAGGASIDVYWTDGPTAETVEQTTNLYRGATFDGMRDLMEYHDTVLVGPDTMDVVHFGANFIFTHRELSPTFIERCMGMVTYNGHDAHGAQCQPCGSWIGAGDRWVAQYVDHRGTERITFACTEKCAAKHMARHIPA